MAFSFKHLYIFVKAVIDFNGKTVILTKVLERIVILGLVTQSHLKLKVFWNAINLRLSKIKVSNFVILVWASQPY